MVCPRKRLRKSSGSAARPSPNDIRQAKRLSILYGLSLDELISFDLGIREIQDVIDRTSQEVSDKIDWTKAWSKQYPVLA